MHAEDVLRGMQEAAQAITGEGGAEDGLGAALRTLDRIAGKAGGDLDAAIAGLDRAVAEVAECNRNWIRSPPVSMTRAAPCVEERLFALRDLARKHRSEVDDLPAMHADLARRLAALTKMSIPSPNCAAPPMPPAPPSRPPPAMFPPPDRPPPAAWTGRSPTNCRR